MSQTSEIPDSSKECAKVSLKSINLFPSLTQLVFVFVHVFVSAAQRFLHNHYLTLLSWSSFSTSAFTWTCRTNYSRLSPSKPQQQPSSPLHLYVSPQFSVGLFVPNPGRVFCTWKEVFEQGEQMGVFSHELSNSKVGLTQSITSMMIGRWQECEFEERGQRSLTQGVLQSFGAFICFVCSHATPMLASFQRYLI